MELEELIRELEGIIGEAAEYADAYNVDEAYYHLRKAKKLLNKEFLNE